ncbi:hypothetical protein [Azospirillum brasilense]|uniref:hypothetical protein n=1 Tax=Azospirillum brasilense TaxID=192 RepID=UPI001178BE66|nr:hypothetical protein [Azospirillum brasilense]
MTTSPKEKIIRNELEPSEKGIVSGKAGVTNDAAVTQAESWAITYNRLRTEQWTPAPLNIVMGGPGMSAQKALEVLCDYQRQWEADYQLVTKAFMASLSRKNPRHLGRLRNGVGGLDLRDACLLFGELTGSYQGVQEIETLSAALASALRRHDEGIEDSSRAYIWHERIRWAAEAYRNRWLRTAHTWEAAEALIKEWLRTVHDFNDDDTGGGGCVYTIAPVERVVE